MNTLRVLVACEFSGIVRDAFIEAGHDAMSCDLLPTERSGRPHYQEKSMTEFRTVIGYNEYRVSSSGVIQSRWRRGNNKSPKSIEWNTLKGKKDAKGYLTVALCDGLNKPKTLRIHRIVARAFFGDPPENSCVRHLDGNPENNSVENLAYGSYTDNENDKIRHGTWNSRCGGAKLTDNDVKEIRESAANGDSQKEIAKRYSVSRPTITRIVNNTIWRQPCV